MTEILKCRVSNILGVREVEFAPDGKSVTIGGANGSGKSSTLWALCMALGGRQQLPPEPVRNGAEKGEVVIELDRFTVRYEVTPDRKSRLVVESADGARYPSPQKMLDELFGGLSFDPGAFKSMDEKRRYQTLAELVQVDLSKFAARVKELTEERLLVGRKHKELQGKLAGRERMTAPEQEVSVAELTAKLKEVQAHNRKRSELQQKAGALQQQAPRYKDANKKLIARISQLEAEIAGIKAEIEANEKNFALVNKQADDILAALPEDRGAEAEALWSEVQSAETTNQAVRYNTETAELQKLVADVGASYDGLTREIDAVRDEQTATLAAAKYPIEGLRLTEEGAVMFEEIPFEQLSESEQWLVSMSVGFALNPQGIVFMRNSGGLDARSRETIRQRAAELGVQLFLEVVDDTADCQIVIEEGAVKENRIRTQVDANEMPAAG